MSNWHGITKESLLRTLPSVLAGDESVAALAEAAAEVLAGRVEEIENLNIYARIDELPEELLDILAYDFKVDWWDADYSLAEKRATLKGNWAVHRRLGTPSAVLTAISAIYPETSLSEWWQYGGKPYHFKLIVDATDEDVDSERHKRVLERVSFYKNLRSHLDGIGYSIRAEGVATARAGTAYCGSRTSMEAAVRINGVVDRPRAPVGITSAAAYAGAYTSVAANVAINGTVQRPHAALPASVGAAAAGVYTQITMEVAVNGLE